MTRLQTVPNLFPSENRSKITTAGEAELIAPLQSFVNGVFQAVVRRSPEPADIRKWTEEVLAGAHRSEPVNALFLSQEKREKQIQDQYRMLLSRSPNADGLSLFTGILMAGKQIEEVMACVLSSSEYFAKNGGNSEGFIKALFRDVLLRKPNETEDDSLIGLLSSHSVSRMAIAHDFVTSDEYRTTQVQQWFQTFLNRLPDLSEVQTCLAELKMGTTQEQIQASILGSDEYFTRQLI